MSLTVEERKMKEEIDSFTLLRRHKKRKLIHIQSTAGKRAKRMPDTTVETTVGI